MAIVMMTGAAIAQPMQGMRHAQAGRGEGSPMHVALNLTEDQQKQITALRITHQKEMVQLQNDMAIKRAELQKYKTAEKPDMAQINSTIDAIGKLNTEMQKKMVVHQLAVRNLLTEEQKLAFDARGQHGGMGRGFCEECGRGAGKQGGVSPGEHGGRGQGQVL
jgi:Spy/CpxP family protein refolding chaperone